MGKGVLLEMAGRQAVVLTPQGEFKKIPAPRGSWEIGDEIEFAEPRGSSLWTRWGAAAAAAAVLMVGSFVGYEQYTLTLPVAIVTVDINPSLELTLNKKDQVLNAQPLNNDGELVLQGVSWQRKPFDEVIRAVTHRAVDEQKLNPADEGSAVLVGVAPAKEIDLAPVQAERLVVRAKAAVTTEVTTVADSRGQETKTSVAVLVASAKEKKEAAKEGLSVGEFKLLPEIQAVAPQVTTDALKDTGPGRLLKELHIDASEVFSKAEKKNEESRPASGNAGADRDDKKTGKDDEKGQGPSQKPPQANSPGNGAKSGNKSGDQQPAEPEKKGPPDKKDEPGKPNGSDKKAEPEKKAEPDKKAEPEKKPGQEQKNDSDKKNDPKKDEPNKGQEKKNSWTIPFLGITIEKPAFLIDKDEPQPPDLPETSDPSPPRAEQPGAGAPGQVDRDAPTGNNGNGNSGNGSNGNGNDAKGNNGNGNDAKGNDAKGNDAKGNNGNGNSGNGNDPKEKQPQQEKTPPRGKGTKE